MFWASRKTAPCALSEGAPYTAILDPLGPPAHTSTATAIPPIWNLELLPRQTSGLTSRLSVLKVEIIETSGCHRTVQRPFLAPPNGSERFRSIFWGFACNSGTIPLAVCGAVRPVPVPLGICRGGTRFQLSDFWLTLRFCLTLPKKVRLLPGNFVKLTFCILNFNLWHSIYCTLVFQSSGFVTE